MSKEEISFTETEVTELTGLIVKTLQLWRCPDVDQIQQRERFYGLQSIRAASQRCRKKQDENGKNMNHITLDQPSASAVSFGVIQLRGSNGGRGRRLRVLLRMVVAIWFG